MHGTLGMIYSLHITFVHALLILIWCSPGRFFASTELKGMLAYVVMTYDVKFEDEGIRPPNIWFERRCIPNMKAKMLFRARKY
jgi:hypothetical protein